MKTIHVLILITALGFTNSSLFAPVIHVNPNNPTNNGIGDINLSTPIIVDYTPPPARNISVFLDNGSESPKNDIFFYNSSQPVSNIPITNDLCNALNTNPKNPIFASESLMNNLALRQIIVQDFLSLPNDQLFKKYNNTEKFATQDDVDLFKQVCTILYENNLKVKTAFDAYQTAESKATLDDLTQAINQSNSIVTNLETSLTQNNFKGNTDDAKNFMNDISYNYLVYNNAFNEKNWAMGRTADGCYVLLPKDQDGAIEPTGLNYQQLNGFNGTEISNPFDIINAKINTATVNSSDVVAISVRYLLDIIKIKTATSQDDPSKITFNPDDYAKLNIYLTGHGTPKTNSNSGTLAGIDIDDFNTTIVPALEKAYTQSFTYESCYGSDVNAQNAFKPQDSSIGAHSFSIINGSSTLTRLTGQYISYIVEMGTLAQNELDLYQKTGIFSTQEELKQQLIDRGIFNRFNNYFDTVSGSITDAISNFFIKGKKDYEFINLPTIKLATTDTWVMADYVQENILQVSNIKNRTNSADKKSFSYDFKTNGGLLTSSETITVPIIIEVGAELPFIVPLSTGKKIHYIEDMTIKDPSITIEMFIKKSIKPFIDEMNAISPINNLANKNIVIESLKIKDGTATLVINGNCAIYTLQEEQPNSRGKRPLHSLQISDENYTMYSVKIFETILEAGRSQAIKEKLEIEKIEGISTTIHDRQATLLLIQKLTAGVDWQTYLRTHDVSNKDAILNAVINALSQDAGSSLSPELLFDLSPRELQVLGDIIKTAPTGTLSPDLVSALNLSRDLIEQEVTKRQLQITLDEKVAIDTQAATDWYMTLSLNDQALIKYEFNVVLENGTLLTQDPNTLSNKERLLLINYSNEIINLSSSPTQIADLQAKLATLTMPRDETKFAQYVHDKFQFLSTGDFSTLLDWFSALDGQEKAPLDIESKAFFINKLMNDPYLATFQLGTLNSIELFELKINLENFLSSSNDQKDAILAKASGLNGSPITLENIINTLSNGLPFIDQSLQKSFNTLSKEQQLILINPNSVDSYAQIFRELSFKMQTTIAQSLDLLQKTLTTDLLDYQKSLLPERISHAATPGDLNTIQEDLKAAMALSGLTYNPATDMPTDFQSTYNKLFAQQNQRIAEHAPSIPNAGSTGKIDFDPTIINEQTGQPIAPNTNPDNPNPVNPNDAPGQLIPNVNPDYKNEELEAEYEKEKEQEMAQEQEARAEEVANEAAQEAGSTERTVG